MPDGEKIDGERLKSVLDVALRLFGDAGRQYIMDDLAARGIRFDKAAIYSLEQVQKALSVLGDDGSALVIERVKKEMARA